MVQIRLCDPQQLDMMQYCNLQKSAFGQLFKKYDIDGNYLNPAFFSWKYNTPVGKARIALAEESGKILASVAMHPVKLIKDGQIFKSWHFVEAATMPEARGRGLFHSCMKLLIDSLAEGEMIYVFPNQTSMQGTLNLGFQKFEELSFYTKFFLSGFRSKTKSLSQCNLFTAEQDIYANIMHNCGQIMVYRDAAYMNWRYNKHPNASYYSFCCKKEERITGNIVIRPVIINGIKILLLMEFHALNKVAEKQLLLFLKEVSRAEKCSIAGIFSTKQKKTAFWLTGMHKVPSVLLPKKQILMGYNKMKIGMQNVNWFCQTGDWDAF